MGALSCGGKQDKGFQLINVDAEFMLNNKIDLDKQLKDLVNQLDS
jgi:hypothetical protein